MHAKSPIGLLNLDLSGGFSKDGTAVGGAIAVNVLTPTPRRTSTRRRSTETHVDVAGALQVKAETSIDPIAPPIPSGADRLQGWVPQLSSVAIGGAAAAAATRPSPARSSSTSFDSRRTPRSSPAQVNSTRHGGGGQTVEVTANDDTHLINLAGGLAISLTGGGVAVSVIVDVIDKDVTASIDDSANVWAGGTVTVQALSTEKLFELAIVGAVSGTSAAVTGSFIVVVLDEAAARATTASIGAATVTSGGLTHVKASDTLDKLQMYAGNVAIGASSAGVGVAATVLVRKGNVDAHVAKGANLTVGSLTSRRSRTERTSSSPAPARAARARLSPARSSSTSRPTRRPRRSTARPPRAAASPSPRPTRRT